MGGLKITELDANVAPLTTDLLAMVDDPAGTALSQKITIANLLTLFVSNVVVQTFTAATGTYTPTAGMKKCLAICVGGGGGGGGGLNTDSAGGGGGGGGTSIELLTAATIGASIAVHAGAGGLGSASGQASTAGDASHLGADGSELLIGGGGQPGTAGTGWSSGVYLYAAGGAGGTASGGDLNIGGGAGRKGIIWNGTYGQAGEGGRSFLSGGGKVPTASTAGIIGGAYGGGGSGGHAASITDKNGGAGAAGVVYIIEFLG